MSHFDLIILGGGPGGYVAAIKAAQLGLKTALVEKETLGGVCLNWGCIPTKALLKTAEVLETIKKASDFGIEIKEKPVLNLPKAVERSRQISLQLTQGIAFLLKKNKVTHIKGHGQLKGPREILVESSDRTQTSLTAPHIILATGARARLLPMINMEKDSKFFWTSKEAMTPEKLPKSLLILGSGAIGMEFASFYRSLGVDVTVVEMMARILPQEDREISELAHKLFQEQGIKILTETRSTSFTPQKDLISVSIETKGISQTLSVEKVLLAIGIEANTQNIGLETTAIKLEKGHILTDDFCETHEKGVYAIGDVAGPPWLAHKGSHEGILAVRHIKGETVHPLDPTKIPGCIYTTPQIASVGLTEEKAKSLGFTINVGRFPFSANGKALALGAPEGMIKTIFDSKTGELLGAHMIGAEVTELIQGFTLARTLEATEAEIMETVFPHPTLSEMMHESTLQAFNQAIHI
ncbi:MAG: dihydrolipoyl dehydrogenase [Alphaproteobacteria bacterium 16-39-46]|nr:MAG: dihydrolipoyl dehydrogenase [Alphaproteobacteria bacterium 16-39-46]OZA44425.1 MAG: dihydrolipoyl dehydrogenase [Alphaproteobacteria bacterium 17-39-52]HQS83311.1 dihydrolipoyl dehydrogenase [Alphaproteobacteria bacterium]HQS93147.1 dihydrolipoyl dehydrogenase [Alphaproteobacteria bacterium]